MGFRNPQETGRPVKIKDEGLTISNNVASIDFAGSGVVGSAIGDDITETISGVPGTPVSATTGAGLTGAVDGNNQAFEIAHTPISGTLKVFVNGARQLEGASNDYTVSGTTITFNLAPMVGSNLIVDYSY